MTTSKAGEVAETLEREGRALYIHRNPSRREYNRLPPDRERIVGEFPTDPARFLRVGLRDFGRNRFLTLRVFGHDPHGEPWPLRGVGLSLPVELLPALGSAIAKAIRSEMERDPDRLPQWAEPSPNGSAGPASRSTPSTMQPQDHDDRVEPAAERAKGG